LAFKRPATVALGSGNVYRDHGTSATSSAELGLALDDVVILFASDEWYVPYLSVALESIVEHTDPARNYDVVILSTNITPVSMRTLCDQVERDNFHIGFLDAPTAMGDVELPCRGHFRKETYYRLMAPEMLPDVSKAIYLDSDLVALTDVAALFDTDVDGYLLAATRDADTAGQCDGYDCTVKAYLEGQVGLDDTHTYFQAGVLLLNLEEFRRRTTSDELVGLATEHTWKWLDQDVLNHVARNGGYRAVDMRWNVLVDWEGLRRTHIIGAAAPEVRAAYEKARLDPLIVHYAGTDDRPWVNPKMDMAEYFWDYASRCPYHDEILQRLHQSRHTLHGWLHRFPAFFMFKFGMPIVDWCLPPGRRRRAWFILKFYHFGGYTG
jgi:lipopolysaccharide biosynthesis glycosyltransferase